MHRMWRKNRILLGLCTFLWITFCVTVESRSIKAEDESLLYLNVTTERSSRAKRANTPPPIKDLDAQYSIKHVSYTSAAELIANPDLLVKNVIFDNVVQEKGSSLFKYPDKKTKRFKDWKDLMAKSTNGAPHTMIQSKMYAKDHASAEVDILDQQLAFEKAQKAAAAVPQPPPPANTNGKKPKPVPKQKVVKPKHITKDRYNSYDIVYEINPKSQLIDLHIVEYTDVKLELDVMDGKLKHFEKTIPDAKSTKSESKYVASIDKDKFETMEKIRDDLFVRKDPQMTNQMKQLAKETDSTSFFNELTSICNAKGRRRKRSTSSMCPLVTMTDSQQNSATNKKKKNPRVNFDNDDTNQLVSKYSKGNDAMKAEVISEVKKRQSRAPDGPDAKRQTALIKADDLRNNVKVTETVVDIQSSKKKVATVDSLVPPKLTKSKVKLSPSAMKRKVVAIANGKGVQKFSKKLGKVSKPLGHFFLAKGVINGVQNGDVTSLAIIGGKLALDTGLDRLAARYAAVSAKTLGKVGKVGKFLGTYAGPIGAVVDVGLSCWQLGNGINALVNAKSKVDKTDAILTIVDSSIDIAITIAVAVLAVSFPFLAPVIAIVANLILNVIFTVARAKNEVERINSIIPLLENEKDEQFWKHATAIFSKPKQDYVDLLVASKKANNVVVEQQLKFLQENDWLIGAVFPSRTFDYVSCRLEETFSYGIFPITNMIATQCVFNGKCAAPPDNDVICENRRPWKIFLAAKYLSCVCDNSIEHAPSFGYAHKDSVVDFRSQDWVWPDRAVPDELAGADFICKPGAKTDQGVQISQRNPVQGYYCKNAIAIRQSTEQSTIAERYMFFGLEDGFDEVFQDPLSLQANYYHVTSGQKNYYGGNGVDVFQIQQEGCEALSGLLDGGGGEKDVLQIGTNCVAAIVDFAKQALQLQGDSETFTVSILGIEQVSGRPGLHDTFVVGPKVTYVDGGGGPEENPDVVEIPATVSTVQDGGTAESSEASLGHYAIAVRATGHTIIKSMARSGQVTLLTTNDSPANITSTIKIEPNPSSESSKFLFFAKVQFPCSQVKFSWSKTKLLVVHGDNQYSFHLDMNEIPSTRTLLPEFMIAFEEGHELESLLRLTYPFIESFIHHKLSKDVQATRHGMDHLKNVFEIGQGHWTVIGGSKNDDFNIHSDVQDCTIDGGGGQNTLRFAIPFASVTFPVIDLNLNSGAGLQNHPQVRNIQNVILPAEYPATVACACTTKSVYAPGGTLTQPQNIALDLDSLQASGECHVTLQVVLQGASTMKITNKKYGKADVNLIIRGQESEPRQLLNVYVEADMGPGTTLSVMLYSLDWTQVKATKGHGTVNAPNSRTIRLKSPTEGVLDFAFEVATGASGPKNQETLVPIFHKDQYKGTLMVGRSDGPANFLLIVNATSNKETIFNGMLGLRNIFQVENGTGCTLIGGKDNDAFLLNMNQAKGLSINGGGGDNSLVINSPSISTKSNPANVINLADGELSFNQRVGRVQNVKHVAGGEGLKDIIHVNSDTLSVNGRGGVPPSEEAPAAFDEIIISDVSKSGKMKLDFGKHKMEISAGSYTIVRNSASDGEFVYRIDDLTTCKLEFENMVNGLHSFIFQQGPEVISAIHFDGDTNSVNLQLTSGIVHKFPQSKVQNNLFSNPKMYFTIPGQFLSAVDVYTDGRVQATFQVQSQGANVKGLPTSVNNFVVAASISSSEPAETKVGRLLGNEEAVNKLFITNEFCAGHTLLVDLHEERGYLSCVADAKSLQNIVDLLVENFQTPPEGPEEKLKSKSGKSPRKPRAQPEDKYPPFTKPLMLLKQMDEVVARPDGTDIALPHCTTTAIVSAEAVVVYGYPDCDQGYRLSMTLGPETSVTFVGAIDPETEDLLPVYGTFHYRFLSPRSFDFNNPQEVVGDHLYMLPFPVSLLESIDFSLDIDTLTYKVKDEKGAITATCSHYMVSLFPEKEFYSQPRIVTADSYQIQVSRTGAIFLTTAGSHSNVGPKVYSQSELFDKTLPEIQALALRLKVTIITDLGTDTLVYAGHRGTATDRNVLQNALLKTSYLLGGGSADTLYEILDLKTDVFILPGFHERSSANPVNDEAHSSKHKQTINLSHMVSQIREETQTKYLPSISQEGLDLVIRITGHENRYPGKVLVVNGTLHASRLQVLAHASMMDLSFGPIAGPGGPNLLLEQRRRKRSIDPQASTGSWILSPRPVVVRRGYTYALSPEDLETGQQFVMEDQLTGTRSRRNADGTPLSPEKVSAKFQVTKDGSSLLLTNVNETVLGTNGGGNSDQAEVTTVIISDFYNSGLTPCSWSKGDNCTDSTRKRRNAKEEDEEALFQILDVQFGLPGAELVLNHTKVLEAEVTEGEEKMEHPGSKFKVVKPLEWTSVLEYVEDVVLKDLPELRFKTGGSRSLCESLVETTAFYRCRGMRLKRDVNLSRRCCYSVRQVRLFSTS